MKKFIVGLVSGLMIASSVTVIASSGRNITVFDSVNQIVVNKVNKPLDKKNSPFVYNGTSYVPLRFVADALGEAVDWDGKTGTIYIGETDNKNVHHWGTDIKHISVKEEMGLKYAYYYNENDKAVKANTGEMYSNFFTNGLNTNSYASRAEYQLVEFPLNGKYKEFVSIVGLTDRYTDSKSIVDVNIYVDEKKVQTFTFENGDMPQNTKVDIVGANKIGFEIVENVNSKCTAGIEIGFFNGEFIK